MPSGHTTKKTLTHYRAKLLGWLPAERKPFRVPERRQFNEMARFGWVESRGGTLHRTAEGTRLLNEKNALEGFALVAD